MKILLELFITFFKIGAFTFGGGLAMFPMLRIELIEKRNWITEDDLMNYYSIGQCTPGIIAVNTATFVGHKMKGKIGAIFATFGIVCPSLIIILAIAGIIKNFLDIQWVVHMFNGIKIAVAVLILDTVLGLLKKNVKKKNEIALFLIALILNFVLKTSPFYIIFASIILGVCLTKYKGNNKKGGA
ncbi:MAG: chromate transporter [Eubacteriales bacterium]|nr:chromate transporter [Eubacteriales bacterium]